MKITLVIWEGAFRSYIHTGYCLSLIRGWFLLQVKSFSYFQNNALCHLGCFPSHLGKTPSTLLEGDFSNPLPNSLKDGSWDQVSKTHAVPNSVPASATRLCLGWALAVVLCYHRIIKLEKDH